MFHLLNLLRAATPAPIINPINSNPPDLSWLGPTIGAIGLVLVALISLTSVFLGKHQDRKNKAAEQRGDAEIAIQPTVTDGWAEVTRARNEATHYYNLYRAFEAAFYTVSGALRHLARIFRTKLPDETIDQDILDGLAVVPPDTADIPK